LAVKAIALRNFVLTYLCACYFFDPEVSLVAFVYSPTYIIGEYFLLKDVGEESWVVDSVSLAFSVCVLHHCAKKTVLAELCCKGNRQGLGDNLQQQDLIYSVNASEQIDILKYSAQLNEVLQLDSSKVITRTDLNVSIARLFQNNSKLSIKSLLFHPDAAVLFYSRNNLYFL
jgi:hypothetical protein